MDGLRDELGATTYMLLVIGWKIILAIVISIEIGVILLLLFNQTPDLCFLQKFFSIPETIKSDCVDAQRIPEISLTASKSEKNVIPFLFVQITEKFISSFSLTSGTGTVFITHGK